MNKLLLVAAVAAVAYGYSNDRDFIAGAGALVLIAHFVFNR